MKNKKKNTIILFLMALYFSPIQAQDTIKLSRFRIGIEVGIRNSFVETNKPTMIRESQFYYSDYDYDYNCGFIPAGQDYISYYGGLNIEYLLSKRFAITGGIRFSYGLLTYSSDNDYFLWKVNETELHTNYVKIKEITQKNWHIGTPISIRLFPSERDYFARQYFVLGAVLNFRVHTEQDVFFANSAMEKYKSQVLNEIEKTAIFQGEFFAGIGLKIGRMNYPIGNVEFHFPVILYGPEKENSLISSTSTFGLEFQTTLQIPMAKKNKLIYIIAKN